MNSTDILVPKLDVPEGEFGEWRIKRFTIDPRSVEYLRLTMRGRPPGLGTFTKLVHSKRGIIMSDTLSERMDMAPAVSVANGNVLVVGLGLGIAVNAMARNPRVKSIRVIEIDEGIINHVGKFLLTHLGDKASMLTFEKADAYERMPNKGERYDYIWWDIWDSICGDNYPEMLALKDRWRIRAKRQGAWAQYECRRSYEGEKTDRARAIELRTRMNSRKKLETDLSKL